MKRKAASRIMLTTLAVALVITLLVGIVPIAFAGGFTDDFSTDLWTHFSGDGTHDSYVDTLYGVLLFNSEASDRDFSYRQIMLSEDVTFEFNIRIAATQSTGRVFIGLADAPDSVWRGQLYATQTQPPSEVTRGIFLVVQGPDNTPSGIQRMYSGYIYGSGNWQEDLATGYDFASNTDYFAKIIKTGGNVIIELWDASKTTLLFQKDWGDICLPALGYLLVSDNYIGSNMGYGWTPNDRVHGCIDNVEVSRLFQLQQVIPEVPLGAVVAGASMLVAFGVYAGLRRRKPITPFP